MIGRPNWWQPATDRAHRIPIAGDGGRSTIAGCRHWRRNPVVRSTYRKSAAQVSGALFGPDTFRTIPTRQRATAALQRSIPGRASTPSSRRVFWGTREGHLRPCCRVPQEPRSIIISTYDFGIVVNLCEAGGYRVRPVRNLHRPPHRREQAEECGGRLNGRLKNPLGANEAEFTGKGKDTAGKVL